jgi:hypothetical protein
MLRIQLAEAQAREIVRVALHCFEALKHAESHVKTHEHAAENAHQLRTLYRCAHEVACVLETQNARTLAQRDPAKTCTHCGRMTRMPLGPLSLFCRQTATTRTRPSLFVPQRVHYY